ncbi:MAG: cardiolipin synthase [Verrucomicrobia bacterium]|nr:MAG: cardiolipin synthase [Verrucomicrobiota bacterium]
MISLFIFLFHLLGLISSVHAVMGTRTAQGAIAWIISLNTFPYLAVPAYWVLGRSRFRGYVTARQTVDHLTDRLSDDLAARVGEFRVHLDDERGVTMAAEKLAEIPMLRGNRVELLIDGEATFDSIIEGIDSAKETILFQFFIVKDDELGKRIQSHLIDRARAGVHVYFLFDEIGSHKLPAAYEEELRRAGVQVTHFHTRKGPKNRFQVNFRNHRKIVVVDSHTAWIGGHNVGDEYLGRDPKFGHWRDTHVRIQGPSALGAQLSFVEDWNWATGEFPQVSWAAKPGARGDIPVLIVPSGPADRLETAALMFVHAINSATNRIWIASPYFVPDEAVMAAMQLAALRGVDVRILIPEKADHLLIWLAAFSYFDEAGKTGVRFYKYTDGFLHQKTMLIDHVASTVGTANFDNRSFRLNFEITAVVLDEGFARETEQMFLNDFKASRLVGEGEYRDKPFHFRLAVRLARLTAPIQ